MLVVCANHLRGFTFIAIHRYSDTISVSIHPCNWSPSLTSLTCIGIRGLDLSKNLIPSWDTVADITIEMPNLRSLRLK